MFYVAIDLVATPNACVEGNGSKVMPHKLYGKG